MKQFDPRQVEIGGNTFNVFPFPAFKATNIFGELSSLIIPMLGAFVPLVTNEEKGLLDVDVADAMPSISGAFNSVSGDKLEGILRKLLVTNKNISVRISGQESFEQLTDMLVDELFCGEAQDLFLLAFEVIRTNYSGFFRKLGGPSGKVAGNLTTFMNSINTDA